MIKYLVDLKENDCPVLKYEVCVNDDCFPLVTDFKPSVEELATFLECEVEDIVQIDFEDFE